MQAQDARVIIAGINAHMRQSGIPNARWYVGITSNVEERLFGAHRVPRQNHWFIYRRAASSNEARAVEAAYHQAGCAGGGGGGDYLSVFVYAYVMTYQTAQ